MCNYATNSITFSSRNGKLVRDLHKKVLACYDAGTGKNLVKNLMKAHGYIVPLRVNNTDYISSCNEFVTHKNGIYYFQCETTSAWEDNMLPIMVLLAEKYDNKVRLSFYSEEPGNDIFLIRDETGIFYPNRYKITWCMDDCYESEYFQDFKELCQYLQQHFSKAVFSIYDSISDIKKSIDLMYADSDKEYMLEIYKIQEYYNDQEYYVVPKEVS